MWTLEPAIFWITIAMGAALGIGIDLWLYFHDKRKYGETPSHGVLMLLAAGSVLLSVPVACIFIVLVRLLAANGAI